MECGSLTAARYRLCQRTLRIIQTVGQGICCLCGANAVKVLFAEDGRNSAIWSAAVSLPHSSGYNHDADRVVANVRQSHFRHLPVTHTIGEDVPLQTCAAVALPHSKG